MSAAGRRDGFGLVSALFVLVVLAAAGAILLNVAGVQRRTGVAALQGARAWHAARSGLEWGIWQALDAGACPPPTTLALAEGGLLGFGVQVSCTSTTHTEDGATARVYRLVAVASYGSFGDADFVRRRLQVTLHDAP